MMTNDEEDGKQDAATAVAATLSEARHVLAAETTTIAAGSEDQQQEPAASCSSTTSSHPGGESTMTVESNTAEAKIARVVAASQIGAFHMIGQATSKDDPLVQHDMNASISAGRMVTRTDEASYEETTESEELFTTAVLIEDDDFVAIIECDVESAAQSTGTVPERDVSNMMIERVVMDGPEDPTREAPMLVEAAPVQKETLQGLCRNRKVQILLLLVVVVTVIITVGVVLGAVPSDNQNDQSETNPPMQTPLPIPPARLNREAFIQNMLPDYARAALENRTSPQSQAFDWLWEEDDPSLPIWRQVQRFALATCAISLIYADLDDVDIAELQESQWLTSAHECSWLSSSARAVVCDSRDQYQVLDISMFGLAGTIPPEVALLSDLAIMDLSGNSGIHGTLPSEIGLLTRMEQFLLQNTQISGTIPHSIAQWTDLSILELSNSQFSGPIPSQLGQLTSLFRLMLGNNLFTSFIPSELGQLDTLRIAELYQNQLIGTIPTTLGQISSMSILLISENFLSGTLPTEFGQMHELEVLYLDNNNFSGTIPGELGALDDLEVLLAHNNVFLTGSISDDICRLLDGPGTLEFISIDCERIVCACNCTCGSDIRGRV